MKKRKLFPVFISIAASIFFLVGCNSTSSTQENTSNNAGSGQVVEGTKLRVGMITDEGSLGDKSFNDITYKGLTNAKEDFGIDLQVLEPKQDTDFIPYMERLSKNSDLVVGVGYKLKEAISDVSKKNSKVNYVMIDDIVEGDNVYNINFKEEEGSFLAGVLAGMMTNTNKIGFIGGIDSPLIKKFEVGFIAGVKSVNPEAGKLLEDGNTSRYAGTFSDVSKGYEIGKSLFDDGVDIVYHAAGAVGIGMFRAAKETGNYCIGVDQDQTLTLPEYEDVILTSMIKNLDIAVYDVVRQTLENGFVATTVELGLKDGAVSLVENKNGKVTQEVLDKVEEYSNKIKNGEIVVPKTIEELKNFNI